MQKKSTTPPKKPTTDASSESLLESLEPSRQAIRFHRCQNPWGLGSEESKEQMRKREERERKEEK